MKKWKNIASAFHFQYRETVAETESLSLLQTKPFKIEKGIQKLRNIMKQKIEKFLIVIIGKGRRERSPLATRNYDVGTANKGRP